MFYPDAWCRQCIVFYQTKTFQDMRPENFYCNSWYRQYSLLPNKSISYYEARDLYRDVWCRHRQSIRLCICHYSAETGSACYADKYTMLLSFTEQKHFEIKRLKSFIVIRTIVNKTFCFTKRIHFVLYSVIFLGLWDAGLAPWN